MTTAATDDFAAIMADVAELVLGPPNKGLSKPGKELRFGKNGSLSIDVRAGTAFDHEAGKGGGVLWLLEAVKGLTPKDGVAWLKERGFEIADREPQGTHHQRSGAARKSGQNGRGGDHPADAPKPKITKTYDYRDADGALLFQVCRAEAFDPATGERVAKTFRQRKPDAEGGWDWSVEDELRRVPYRLPELLHAMREGATVFGVEGEKAADALWALGVPAFNSAGGAGKWRAALNEWFRGADVVLLPDNDQQKKRHERDGTDTLLFHETGKPILAGQDHMREVATNLLTVAKRVRVLELAGLPVKGDPFDWIEAGRAAGLTDEQLVDTLYERANTNAEDGLTYDPAASYLALHPELTRFRSVLGLVLFRDLGTAAEPHEWLVYEWLTACEVSICAGPSGAGKSFFVIEEAFAIARGVPFMGRDVVQGAVVYQAGEGAKGLRSKRIPAYMQRHGLTWKDDLPFALLAKPIDLYGSDDHTTAFIADIRAVEAELGQKVRLVVIDTTSAATPGADENSAKDVGPVLARCNRIARECQAHVRLVAHMNADGTKVRGHTSFVANVDQVTVIRKRDTLHDADKRVIREAEVTKLKDGDPAPPLRFVLKGITIGRDAKDRDITSCTIAPPNEGDLGERAGGVEERRQGADGASLSAQAYNLLRAVERATEEAGVVPPAGSGITLPYGMRVAPWARVRDLFVASSFEDGDDDEKRNGAIRQALKRNGEQLMAKGLIGKHDKMVWRTDKPLRGRRSRPATGPANDGVPPMPADLMPDAPPHTEAPATGAPDDPW